MSTRKKPRKTAEEKVRIIQEISRLGVVAGVRKHNIAASTYYDWLDKYEANGLKGLSDKRKFNDNRELKAKDKEIRLLKEIIADKELQIKLQNEMLEKKFPAWKRNV